MKISQRLCDAIKQGVFQLLAIFRCGVVDLFRPSAV